ncbi:MAG: type II secretion system F family protein [Planctomycetota bacterium]|jgi:type II secretory pathway component PulF
MTVFNYRALTRKGGKTSGTVEAASRREANEILRGRGVHVTSIRTAGGLATRTGRGVSAGRGRHTFLFTGFMRRLLRAGMPVVSSLEAAGSELGQSAIGDAVERVRARVAGGSSLAEALSHEKEFFDDLYVAMVRAAESSGTLAASFDNIYKYEARRRELRKRIISALAYPIVLVSVSIIAVAFLLTYVVPNIRDTLKAARIPLPLVTRVVMAAGDLARAWGLLILAAFVIIAVSPRILRSFEGPRRFLDTALTRIPIFGRFVRAAAVARFSRTLSALLRSGLRVAEGLSIAAGVSRNYAYERAIADARSRIVSGGDLADALGESGLFPSYAVQIVGVGERTGALADSFEDIALSEEEALETAAERGLTLLEPAVILMMAVVVGFIVASVLLPILSLSNIQ